MKPCTKSSGDARRRARIIISSIIINHHQSSSIIINHHHRAFLRAPPTSHQPTSHLQPNEKDLFSKSSAEGRKFLPALLSKSFCYFLRQFLRNLKSFPKMKNSNPSQKLSTFTALPPSHAFPTHHSFRSNSSDTTNFKSRIHFRVTIPEPPRLRTSSLTLQH